MRNMMKYIRSENYIESVLKRYLVPVKRFEHHIVQFSIVFPRQSLWIFRNIY